MDRKEILTIVRAIILKHEKSECIKVKDITLDKSISNDLYIDSLDFVEIIMQCEREFDISIPDEMMSKCDIVSGLCDTIKELIEKQ